MAQWQRIHPKCKSCNTGGTMQETWVWSPGWEDPLEKGMATHSNSLAWRIPWTEEPGGLQSMGSQKSQTWLATTQHNNNTSQTSMCNWMIQFSSVTQSCLTLRYPMNCSTPGLPVHHQLRLISIESVMPSNHLILCHPLLLLPLIFASIRVFYYESVLQIR